MNLQSEPSRRSVLSMPSPAGRLLLTECGGFLAAVEFTEKLPAGAIEEETPLLCEVQRQLEEYFAGGKPKFDFPLAELGSTFQQRVWAELRKIPYGITCTYGALARQISCASARAVGGAVGRNPWPVVVPCHRVIAAGGAIGGFSGGVERKIILLEREGITLRRN
ncbi:MAG: methylated-DNA--[protein]-cysteine S-methyltransferase [Victivallaceae bacterium]|nr:methylated-DNA--[protein]-cysteine S-methyltransferase [Victivallaceae bacterium]